MKNIYKMSFVFVLNLGSTLTIISSENDFDRSYCETGHRSYSQQEVNEAQKELGSRTLSYGVSNYEDELDDNSSENCTLKSIRFNDEQNENFRIPRRTGSEGYGVSPRTFESNNSLLQKKPLLQENIPLKSSLKLTEDDGRTRIGNVILAYKKILEDENSSEALKKQAFEKIKYFIGTQDDTINELDDDGQSVLFLAVENNMPDVVTLLLDANAMITSDDMPYELSVIHIAIEENKVEILDLLLDKATLDDLQFIGGCKKLTVLAAAVSADEDQDHLSLINYLINVRKVDINQKDEDGFSALTIAINNKSEFYINLLVQAGAQPDQKDFELAHQQGPEIEQLLHKLVEAKEKNTNFDASESSTAASQPSERRGKKRINCSIDELDESLLLSAYDTSLGSSPLEKNQCAGTELAVPVSYKKGKVTFICSDSTSSDDEK